MNAQIRRVRSAQVEGVVVSTRQLQRYAEAIRRSPHNLLSPRGLDELESRHLPECAAFAASLPPRSPVLDVGSGAGLPGMVIALVREDLEVHLLDATRKKTRFLQETADRLGVHVVVHTGRAEELGRGALAGRYPTVTARAVAPLDRLVGYVAPLLAPGGVLHAIKGASWADELDTARSAMARTGLELVAAPDMTATAANEHTPRVVMLRRRP